LSDALKAAILGVIEGLTEFLPVSSTGHMIIAYPLLGVDPEAPLWHMFLILCQLGAILAVVLFFWRDLCRQMFHMPPGGWRSHLMTKLVVGCLPAAVFGLALNDYIEAHLETNPNAVAGALIVGAIAMELIERRYRRAGDMTIDDVTLRQAFLIGLAQCVAMFPGVSRAAATIMGGLVVGLTPRVAAHFSFYLAIPTMLGASLLRVVKHRSELTTETAGVMGLGTAVAFGVALAVIAMFLPYVQKHRFTPFAIYRIALGVAVLWWMSGR
jgi:undecaprenyl-diphosphatase